jgi:DNA-binding NarL/FixJ family response regulator
MTRGTLVLSRNVNLHSHYRAQLEDLGFMNVTVTAADGKELMKLINELKPRLVLADCNFYHCSTPFMMLFLLEKFPGLNIAVVCDAFYPPGLSARFVAFGVNSCVCYIDGHEQFYQGLKRIRDGYSFVSISVQKRLEAYDEYPKLVKSLTRREIEITRLLCNGFKTDEIAETLHISISTVDKHKTAIYKKLNVRNENELIRVALYLGIIEMDELNFFGGDFGSKNKRKK